MQAIQLQSRVIRRLVSGEIFGAAVALTVFISLCGNAAEPVITLAMARPMTATVKMIKAPAIAEPVRASAALLHREIKPETAPAKVEVESAAFQNAHLEKQTVHRAPLILLRENLNSNRSVCVAAGYGQLWNDQSMLKHLSASRQEPGCAYIKASFNF
jgi:hypothetical protein